MVWRDAFPIITSMMLQPAAGKPLPEKELHKYYQAGQK